MVNIKTEQGVINSVRVLSVLGQELYFGRYDNASKITVDLSNYANGTYFVTLNETKVIRIVKN